MPKNALKGLTYELGINVALPLGLKRLRWLTAVTFHFDLKFLINFMCDLLLDGHLHVPHTRGPIKPNEMTYKIHIWP